MTSKRYKYSVIQGFVFRIYRACSPWEKFHKGLVKTKGILERNQDPLNFHAPIASATIEKIVKPCVEKVTISDTQHAN